MASSAVARLFPLPFVAIVVLLAVLILLTPNLLLTGGPAAGSLASQAQLTIDRPPGNATLHFYIQGLSPVRYAEMQVYLATNVSWPAPTTAQNLSWWNASYDTQLLALAFSTSANPVAVNVTVTYVDPAGTAVEYWGVYEFDVQGATLLSSPLDPRVTGIPDTPLGGLPITILLEAATPGAVR